MNNPGWAAILEPSRLNTSLMQGECWMKSLVIRAITIAISVMISTAVNAGQTRQFNTQHGPVLVEVVSDKFHHPWSLAFLPDGRMLVTERRGRLFLVGPDGTKHRVGFPLKVVSKGQGGLLDIVVDPELSSNHTVYFSFSEPRDGGTGTSVASAVFRDTANGPELQDVRIIFRQSNPGGTVHHFGSRIVIHTDGTLFVTIGDRGGRERAQDPFDHAGSVIRINKDGTIPSDNPFANGVKGAPEIWSIGHRNPQGAALNPITQRVWTIEHGAKGGDELNRPDAGKNYGWPIISYGRHYSGFKIGKGTKAEGYEQPAFYWDPSIAPSGLTFYSGKLFPQWKNNLFAGALKFKQLVRLSLTGERIKQEEILIKGSYGRVRDVREGPAGALWVLTDQANGKLLKITPAK